MSIKHSSEGAERRRRSAALVLALIGFIAMRYVSRGVGEVKLLVMSGVASALFYGLTMMLRRLGR